MRKTLSFITAIILVVSIALTFAGCKGDGTTDPTVAPVNQDFRLIYEEIILDDVLLQTIADDSSRYKDIVEEDFGLGKEGADNFYDNYAEYALYGMTVKILNYTDTDAEIIGIESDSNGKNGVYIRKTFNGAENGVSAKQPESDYFADAITLHVLNANPDFSDEQVVNAVKAMNLTLVYKQGGKENKLALKLENNVAVTQAASGETVIRLSENGFAPTEALWKTYTSDANKYKSAIASDFGLGEEGAKAFFASPENYYFFNSSVNIENVSSKDIVVYGVSVADNGKNGVYVKVAFSGELGIPAKQADGNFVAPPVVLHVLSSNAELTDEQVLSAVKSMTFNITYAEKSVNGDTDSENVGEQKTVAVKVS